MATFDALSGLALTLDDYGLEGLARVVSSGFERRTTVIHLRGASEEGIGEDVTYEGEDHVRQLEAGPVLPLAGEWTLASFSAHLGALDLFPATGVEPPPVFRLYRRWGFESAALDLALRQAGRSLADAVGREPHPMRFVVSLRLGSPPSLEPVLDRLAVHPGLRFKLDATPEWDDAIIDGLVATGAVDAIDFKGAYKGTAVDVETDPELYRRIAEAFPDAWLEDPNLDLPAAREVLEPHRDRITWDAPIHSVEDIRSRRYPPRTVNLKPSRFGSLEALCAAYDHCTAEGITAYGGGQFELGPGRGQAQLLAALFHPEGTNDLAPGGYDESRPEPDLPESPLSPDPEPVGFRRRA